MPLELELAVCLVCKLIDGDATPKMCRWCRLCKAWICVNDISKWKRRAKAMRIRSKRLGDDKQGKAIQSTDGEYDLGSPSSSFRFNSDSQWAHGYSSICNYSSVTRYRNFVLSVLSAIRVQIASSLEMCSVRRLGKAHVYPRNKRREESAIDNLQCMPRIRNNMGAFSTKIIELGMVALLCGCAAKKQTQPNTPVPPAAHPPVQEVKTLHVSTSLGTCNKKSDYYVCECEPFNTRIDSKTGKTTLDCRIKVK